MTTVHNVSEDVDEIRPWDFSTSGVCIKVVLQNDGRVSQVTSTEWIHHVETFGAELLSLQHHGVEVAQGEEDGLHLAVLVFKFLLDKECERTLHIGFQSCGRLVGQLD